MTYSGMAAEDFVNGQAFVDGYMDLDWDGRVYEIDPAAMKVLRVLDRKIRFTNGIAFGPDNHLYANASFTGEIYRYDVLGESSPRREVFGNVLQPDANPDFKGPDGMAFDTDGRLRVTEVGKARVEEIDMPCGACRCIRRNSPDEAPRGLSRKASGHVVKGSRSTARARRQQSVCRSRVRSCSPRWVSCLRPD
ncbi:SMP-30/gluconolactonase/LRE family protein [Bradyrhizobium sp. CB82]|uniref:SMP-30/gluconolactonase/LRE family protein n=1 Tax=Bradyrhizobium sp. CB82 TaxID=3039159 RepID=UPI0024B053BD|nr:SMP-30/gluconolactonase/LRE family protein [Bradyrhizobium sp. CB82]WFU39680.1 SMP-30/gluconolactonase/LRE family protein [Bradyrhizobium sp. CB82]